MFTLFAVLQYFSSKLGNGGLLAVLADFRETSPRRPIVELKLAVHTKLFFDVYFT